MASLLGRFAQILMVATLVGGCASRPQVHQADPLWASSATSEGPAAGPVSDSSGEVRHDAILASDGDSGRPDDGVIVNDQGEQAGGRGSDAPCVYDDAAAAACANRPGFYYGPQPFIWCRGTAPDPGELQRIHESLRNSPCVCNDEAAIQQRRRRCSQIP